MPFGSLNELEADELPGSEREGGREKVGVAAKSLRSASRNTWTERGRCSASLAAAQRFAGEFKDLGFLLTAALLCLVSPPNVENNGHGLKCF